MIETYQVDYLKKHKDFFDKIYYFKDGLMGLIHYIRESVADMVFEVFVRSANQAY